MKQWIPILLLILPAAFFNCEEIAEEEEEIPFLKFDQTFNVSVESGWNRGEEEWPTATLWLSTDSIYSSSMVIYSTVSYDDSDILVNLDSMRSGPFAAFMRARGKEQITTTSGTHELIFVNGNVENILEITSEDSSIRIAPIEITYMEVADEGDFWHPTDP